MPKWLDKDLSSLPEREILLVKYASKRIADLNEGEIWYHAPALLMKINVITGWTIPDDQNYIGILNDQLIKKLKEDYSTLNFDEIEFAFRKYGTTIKDWGKSVNLSLIDSVLNLYIEDRFDASQLEERLKGQHEKSKVLPYEKTGNEMKELLEIYIQDAKEKTLRMQFIAVPVYDYLIEQKLIEPTDTQKFEYWAKAISYYRLELTSDGNVMANQKRIATLNKQVEEKKFDDETFGKLKSISKKMIVFDFVNSAQ